MSRQDFFVALCGRMNWAPTPWRLAVFDFWADQEGMPYEGTFNPLATTRLSPGLRLSTEDIGYGPGNWNSVPVRMYATLADGVEATAQTLELDYYENIRRSFDDQLGYPEVVGPRDFTSWVGSDAYGRRVLAFMESTPASKTIGAPAPPAIGVADIVALLGGEAVIRDWLARGSVILPGYAIEQVEQGKLAARLDDHIKNHAAGVSGPVPEHTHIEGKVKR